MFQSRHWELCTCVSAHTTPQAFKLHFEPGWPSEQTKIGQVGGVATDNDGNVYVFHRGQRVWDATWVHTLLLQLFGLGVGVGGGGAPTRNVSASKCPCDPAVQDSCMFCHSVLLKRDVVGVWLNCGLFQWSSFVLSVWAVTFAMLLSPPWLSETRFFEAVRGRCHLF